ncbi:MAG: diaminopimelate decarboxylase [Chloroflexi bacterium]|nr:diaminopimelate decarboxylase [Chloroflexota bacterium]
MAVRQSTPRLPLFPLTAEISGKGHLMVGGCDTIELAGRFGTPLYIYDEAGLRGMCAAFREEFGQRYPTTVIYASKAFMNRAMALLLKEEGLGLDVVSGGEISIASAVDFPMDRLYFHGNNKSPQELELALEKGVGRIVVDNFYELAMLERLAGEWGKKVDILLRLTPGIDPHTHRYNTTGTVDSKFGFTLTTWEQALAEALTAPHLNLVGLHAHLGSSIFEVAPYREAIGILLEFVARMKRQLNFEPRELDLGGGYAVQYTVDNPAPPISDYAEVVTSTIRARCQELGLKEPHLVVEPGRSIVARSGMALYTVGAIKDIPGVRRYVSVDGGMGDNIRYALYGAKHEALIADRPLAENEARITIAGKFCESGDILIKDIELPPVASGDILAVPDCGAYCIPMSSNYNGYLRPAVIMVKDGKARLIRRRESYDDLTSCDVV